jgi:hypothetical protein
MSNLAINIVMLFTLTYTAGKATYTAGKASLNEAGIVGVLI